MNRHLKLLCLSAAASLATATAAHTADFRTFAFAYGGTATGPMTAHLDVLGGSESNLTGAGLAHSDMAQGYDFYGLDAQGFSNQMRWEVTSSATAGFGVLKAGVESALYNPFAGANPPWRECVMDDCVTNLEGTPDVLHIQAQSSFEDTFAVTGAAGLEYVQFAFQLDGGMFTSNPFMTAGLVLFGGSVEPYFASEGATDVTIYTRLLPVDAGRVTLGLVLDASLRHDLRGYNDPSYPGGGLEFGAVDFLHTLTLTSVRGVGASGQTVALASVTSSDGESLQDLIIPAPEVGAVPEPSSWAMMILGLGAAGAVVRRRRVPLGPKLTAWRTPTAGSSPHV